LETDQWPLLVIYSGDKAGTVSYVQQVRALWERWPEPIDSIIQAMLQIVAAGWQALQAGDYPALGQLMNMQHGLLHALGVDTPALASIVFAARQLGALGAKLSGAGGGDCAIALVAPSQYATIKEALRAEGRHVLDIQVNAPGVRRD
jgi:mevalonate kinase